MSQRLGPASSSIVSEVIEGEAVIMDMRSGSYYSADGIGALLWDALLAGADRQQLAEAVSRAYPGESQAAADTTRFIESLLAAELLVAQAEAALPVATPALGSLAYKAPVLAGHDDLQDLILLDPIHDVDDTGWPTRKDAPLPSPLHSIEKK